ncbi:allantoinase AllB [Amycolatopsis sp. CA-230715]|uniref:allantoinase AllB n=1 Tax=Amycolatopsis sp. CA-230715 TaxID=2745196 RepID=UPI001C00DB5F|nr:allantoinase AllB [Amycolatopsis sp. CA-230715]QWF82917.1 Allantoinase [Amycolatopsis sp. CA-230715]
MELVLRARRAVTGAGEGPVAVGVDGGKIVAVEPYDADLPGRREVALGDDAVLLPGLVDTHVHVNDPGRTEWEGFETATAAAAAGGVTTIVDMPLNSLPPTVDVASLEVKRKTAEGRVHVDVGFWGGAVPGNAGELAALHEAGVFGFKCFLLHSGVDEFPPLDPAGFGESMGVLSGLGALMIVHAEDAGTIDGAPHAHGAAYRDFLDSRPRAAENTAIAQVIAVARETGARAHILHLSSSDAIELVDGAKRDGLPISAETCPHYLTFTAEEIGDGATQFKCCPPIREAANRERLWRALGAGTIDCVVSDHSPCTPELKRFDTGDFGVAWGGIASLQLGLPAVWTQARQRGYALTDVVRWMAEAPADQVGLRHKGRIEAGRDADFCVFAPDEAFVVDKAKLRHRNPVSAYHGRPLAGVVRQTWLRGKEIDGEPAGRLLTRG